MVEQTYLKPSIVPVEYTQNNPQVSPIGPEDDEPNQPYEDSFGNSPSNSQQGLPNDQNGATSYPQYNYPDSSYTYSSDGSSFGSSYANQQNSNLNNWDYNSSGSNLPGNLLLYSLSE